MAEHPCCQNISKPTPSPFEVEQLGYYDGVTEGLARCRVCGAAYAFDVVCSSEDGLRVYGFARIAEAHYLAVTTALSQPAPPLDRMHEWYASVARAEMGAPSGKLDRDVFIVASNLEDEVLLARRVTFAGLWEFLEPGDGR